MQIFHVEAVFSYALHNSLEAESVSNTNSCC